MRKLHNAAQLWRTVRHLRLVQIYGRLWFRLMQPRPKLAAAPTLRKQAGIWRLPARRAPSLLAPNCFCILNEIGDVHEIGWDNPEKSKLWRYNLHYFDDLNAEAADERFEWHKILIDDWIDANLPGKGSGWEPYPTALRIVNWIKWALAGNTLTEKTIYSLAVQARWLTRRLEWHLLGNHLFSNAKALVFAGLFFSGSEAEAWLQQGVRILNRELEEQILPDGGQFELSPMYHALALEDVLDLLNIAEVYAQQSLVQTWRLRVPAMLDWLQTMSHPDGQISFFNDAAFGIAPPNGHIVDYADRLGFKDTRLIEPLRHLEHSGYVRMAQGQFVVIADLARIGPEYLPGHAHADTLSIELSISRQRVFVNSGTSEYGLSLERLRQRGTKAHNTVVVADEDSSEVWAGFRVGRRAYPRDVMVEALGHKMRVKASHDGYRFLQGRPLVTRSLELDQDYFEVTDTVSVGTLRCESRYHLHPLVTVSVIRDNRAMLKLADGQRFIVKCDGGALRIEENTWHPQFGMSLPNLCLVLPLVGGRAVLRVMSA